MTSSTLYVEIEGARGESKPVRARRRLSREGRRVAVRVDSGDRRLEHVFLLVRRGHGDCILAASAERETVEAMHQRLGRSRDEYDVAQVPVLERVSP